jgi:putative transposase
MDTHHQLSERHACALVGLSRDAYFHPTQLSAMNQELLAKIVETAQARRRWGYRMILDLLRPQYPNTNHECVHRLYTQAGLAIRKRKKTNRAGVRVPPGTFAAMNRLLTGDSSQSLNNTEQIS